MQDALAFPGARDAEAELIERAKASDRAAWDEIFDRHYLQTSSGRLLWVPRWRCTWVTRREAPTSPRW